MRQLWTAVSQYAEKNAGRLPDSLAEVAAVGDWTRYDFACRARLEEADVADEKLTPIDISRMVQLGEVHYVYLGRGETLKSVQKRPVLVEPLRNHGEGVNVCYGDGSTEWLSEADAEAALRGKPSLDPTGPSPRIAP